jgi:hypothetical protein
MALPRFFHSILPSDSMVGRGQPSDLSTLTEKEKSLQSERNDICIHTKYEDERIISPIFLEIQSKVL